MYEFLPGDGDMQGAVVFLKQSKTLHVLRLIPWRCSKCLVILLVQPALHVISLSHVLHFASSSFNLSK